MKYLVNDGQFEVNQNYIENIFEGIDMFKMLATNSEESYKRCNASIKFLQDEILNKIIISK